jgi:hypothetical protein
VRRPFVLLVSVLAVTCVAGLVIFDGSSAARRAIVCPVGPRVIIPCCGPPVVAPAQVSPALPPIDCCPANAQLCVPTVTIGAKPNPSVSGDQVVVSGQVLRAPASGATVALWQRLPGQSAFGQVAQTTADASGAYTFTRPARHVQTNREWYVTAGGVQSTTMTQSVQAIVTLSSSARKHRRVRLTGSVSPSHRGETILLQRHSAGGWVTIAHLRLNRRSRFALTLRLAHGAQAVQATLPADSTNALSVSPPVTLHG